MIFLAPSFLLDWIFDFPRYISDSDLYTFAVQFIFAFFVLKFLNFLLAWEPKAQTSDEHSE
jgi:hypothetical protein